MWSRRLFISNSVNKEFIDTKFLSRGMLEKTNQESFVEFYFVFVLFEAYFMMS